MTCERDLELPANRIIKAARCGQVDEVESLLRQDLGLIESEGGWQRFRPLFFALEGGHKETASRLRLNGACLNVFEAAALGDVDELMRILTRSPDSVNERRDHYDATPLHAVRDAGVLVARCLISHGADVNATDAQGLTPLHGRAEHGDQEMVDLLISSGANVHSDSCMGSPLHAAVGGYQHQPPVHWREVSAILLSSDADVNFASKAGVVSAWTPLHHAAWRDHLDAVTWLIDRGADPSCVDQHGNTPEQTARHFHHDAIAALLAQARK